MNNSNEDDRRNTENESADPLRGKSTPGKPQTPLIHLRRRGWSVAARVMLWLFFAFVIFMVLFTMIDRTRYQPSAACGLFSFGALSSFFACTALNNRLYCKHRAVGRIVDIKRQVNHRAPTTYVPRIQYSVDGVIYRIWGLSGAKSPVLHSEMDVYYDVKNPATATCRIAKLPITVVTIVLTVAFTMGDVLFLIGTSL